MVIAVVNIIKNCRKHTNINSTCYCPLLSLLLLITNCTNQCTNKHIVINVVDSSSNTAQLARRHYLLVIIKSYTKYT